MNSTTISGRLARDPEPLRRVGRVVAELRVAVADDHDTPVVSVVCHGRLAQAAVRYGAKGRLIGVTGHLAAARPHGAERACQLVVVAEQLDFLDADPGTPQLARRDLS